MRPDMGKIAVDARRHGGWSGKKVDSKRRRGKHAGDVVEAPTRESMSRTARPYGSFRGLGENLAPLKRWLQKQVGRPWDEAYSELNQALQGGYTNLEHIKSHVLGWVHREHVKMIDGWPHRMAYYRWSSRPWIELRKDEFYLDEKGVIRTPPKNRMSPLQKERERKKREKHVIMLDGMTAAVKLDGTWFAADLCQIPTYESKTLDYRRSTPERPVYNVTKVRQHVNDALVYRLTHTRVGTRWTENHNASSYGIVPYDQSNLYAKRLRTLSKKEIKQRIPEALR